MTWLRIYLYVATVIGAWALVAVLTVVAYCLFTRWREKRAWRDTMATDARPAAPRRIYENAQRKARGM